MEKRLWRGLMLSSLSIFLASPEISDPSVSPSRSPQPNDRAERVSERGSGIYSVSHFLLTRFLSLSAPVLCGINAMCYCHATS